MAGKYDSITPSLPKFIEGDSSYRGKIEAEKLEILDGRVELSARDLAAMYVSAREAKEDKEKELKEANLKHEAVREMFCEAMDDEDTTSLTLKNVGALRVERKPYAQVKDKQACRLWCIAEGLEESMVLPWGSIDKITRDRLYDGQPEPDGVEAFQKDKVVLTRNK